MNKAKLIHNVVGLSQTEESVINALTEAKNVNAVVAETGLSRTGIAYCLENLHKRGFVRIIRSGRRRSYIALTTEELTDILKETIDQIKLPHPSKGARIKTSKKDEFVIHVGTREIIPAFTRITTESKNQRVKAIQHHRSFRELQEKMTARQLVEFNQAIIDNHIIVDGILNESAYRDYQEEIKSDPRKFKAAVKSLEGRMADYTFFADSHFDYNAEIWLFKNTSLLINWHDEVAIEITNQSMTAFLRDMFEFVKKDGVKVDHNQAMRSILTNKKAAE